MNMPAASPATARLQRLAGYLAQDPANAALLADACETAIACGAHEQAESYIEAAQRISLDRGEWQFRLARLHMAKGELRQAADLLEELRAVVGEHPVFAHDLAYIQLLQGNAVAARELLQPWVDADLPPAAADARASLQALWLRACHRSGQLHEAWSWVSQQDAAGRLGAAARGVASLIAFDLEELDAARSLADAALAADGEQLEALVARGSVALAEGDTDRASQLLQRALQRHPRDGRTWSALGFASLLRQDFSSARTQLERAVEVLPGDIETWQALGWSRLVQGDRDAAVAAFYAALAIDSSDADSHGALALLHALLGDALAARQHLDAAGKPGADGAALRYARAVLSGEARDPAMLEGMAREALAQWRPRP